MGNVMDSFFSGFTHSIGSFFGSPIDFLSGKSCSSVCPSSWDLICYVENFCVANLAKVALILILSYFFLFFMYMLYKVGFWHCIIHGFCKFLWFLVSCWWYAFLAIASVFSSAIHTKRRRRRRHRRYIEDDYHDNSDDDDVDGSFTNYKSRRECRKEERLRKSLRPRSHRVRVGVRKDNRSVSGLSQHGAGGSPVHGLRVSEESKFARKGSKRITRVQRGPRRV